MRYALFVLCLIAAPGYAADAADADDVTASPGPEASAPTPPWPMPAAMPMPSPTPSRALRGTAFNQARPAITELPSNTRELPTHTHWWLGIPSLPVAQGETVVLGRVFSAQSFVSPDGGTAYTEYLLNVERVFSGARPIEIGEHLTLQRISGLLKFPDGKHQWASQQADLGTPERAGRYVMFLHRNPETDTFAIVTGYRLQAGKVVAPLDRIFKEHTNLKESVFLERVQAAIGGTN